MTLVIPRGQAAWPGFRGGGQPGSAAVQYKRSPMATEGHRASE